VTRLCRLLLTLLAVSLPAAVRASAAEPRVGLGEPLTLSVPSGGPGLTISWSKVSGPGEVTFREVDDTVEATFAATGTYRLRLSVSDGEELAYNEWGDLDYRIDFNGHRIDYTFDNMGRMEAMEVEDSHPSLTLEHATQRIAYNYFDDGQRESATVYNPLGGVLHRETFAYDERGRLQGKTSPQGTLNYTYDAGSNLRAVASTNANGVDLEYGYDSLNRLETVYDHGAQMPPLEHHYSYDANGNLDTLTYANGVAHNWQYDSLNRLRFLTQTRLSDNFQLQHFEYKLRPSGHRETLIEASGRTTQWQYDNHYRLVNENITGDPYGNNGNASYRLDIVGNRIGSMRNFSWLDDQNFAYNQNDWLDGDTYDSNGNTTNSEAGEDTYDFMNRLIRREKADGTVINITYNADGDRVKKVVGGDVTQYLVDRNNLTGYAQVVEELNVSSEIQVVYTYGLDLISQSRLSDETWELSYYLYDGLGSVRALASEDALASDAYFYDAFGNLLHTIGTTENAYLFTGEQWDPDLGMYFLRARYLNPDTGRFHTMDSFEGVRTDPVTLHKYLYAHANPVVNIDPTGMFKLSEVMVVASIVATISNIAIAGTYVLLKSTDVGEEAGDRWVACMEKSLATTALFLAEGARAAAGSIPKILVGQAADPSASRFTSLGRLLSINKIGRPFSTRYANWLKGRIGVGGRATVAVANVVYVAGSAYVFSQAIKCAAEAGG